MRFPPKGILLQTELQKDVWIKEFATVETDSAYTVTSETYSGKMSSQFQLSESSVSMGKN